MLELQSDLEHERQTRLEAEEQLQGQLAHAVESKGLLKLEKQRREEADERVAQLQRRLAGDCFVELVVVVLS